MEAWLLRIDWALVIAYGLGVLLVYLIARALVLPLKLTLELLANALIGAVLLLLFNVVGGYWGYHVPLNPVTAVLAGMLGIPGVALLVVLKYWLFG